MKRHELRRMDRNNNKPMFTYSEYQALKEESTAQALEVVLSSIIVALIHQHKFGASRINRLIQGLNSNMKMLAEQKTSIQNYLKICKDTGMNYDIAFRRTIDG